MVDRTGAARLEWRHWDRFTKVHINYTKATFCFLYKRHIASIKLNSPVSKTHILRNANQMMKNAATIPINTPKVRI